MANPKVKFKRSSVASKRPTLSNLELGELALNTYDGKLFTRQDTSGIGIGTTAALLTPWQESYGGGTITYDGNVNLNDNKKLQIGDSQDLQIYHNETNSYIDNTTGSLYIRGANGNHVRIQSPSGEDSVVASANGSVELYYDNSKKFETTNTGATVTGDMYATAFIGDGSALTGIANTANIVSDNTQVGVITATSQFYPPSLTTTERDAITFGPGAFIYNETEGKLQMYIGSEWKNLAFELNSYTSIAL